MDDGTLHSDFYVSPIEGLEAEASPVTSVTHIAFLADSQQAVQAFHAAALAAGGRDNGAPGPRPYHPGYYSAFVLDPDGNTSRPSSTGRDGSKTIADRRCERLLYDCTTASG